MVPQRVKLLLNLGSLDKGVFLHTLTKESLSGKTSEAWFKSKRFVIPNLLTLSNKFRKCQITAKQDDVIKNSSTCYTDKSLVFVTSESHSN